MAVTIMKMNLRGVYFEVNIESLQRAPYCRLSRLAKGEEKVPLDSRGCYFYDRNPALFHAMLDYFSTGRLDIPLDLSWPVVREELDYWQIDKCLLSPHCLVKYAEEDEFLKKVEEVEKGLDRHDMLAEGAWCQGMSAKTKSVWTFLEDSKSSLAALVYGVLFYVILPVVSVLNAFVYTMPRFSHLHLANKSAVNETMSEASPSNAEFVILLIGVISMSIILLELSVRFLVFPSKMRFFADTLNWCDMLGTVMPAMSVALDRLTHVAESEARLFWILIIHFFWAFAAFRIFRFFRLWRAFDTYKAFSLALKRTASHFFLTFCILAAFMVTFSMFIYVTEAHEEGTSFVHAFRALWFSVNTLSPSGHTAIEPKRYLGRLLASFAAGAGILMVVLPIPAMVTNYNMATRQIVAARALRKAKLDQKNIMLGADLGKAEEGFQSSP